VVLIGPRSQQSEVKLRGRSPFLVGGGDLVGAFAEAAKQTETSTCLMFIRDPIFFSCCWDDLRRSSAARVLGQTEILDGQAVSRARLA